MRRRRLMCSMNADRNAAMLMIDVIRRGRRTHLLVALLGRRAGCALGAC